MIRLAIFTVLILCGSTTHAQNFGIGDEYVEPLRYPKFSVSRVYQFDRKFNGFADDSLRYDLESNLIRYFPSKRGYLNISTPAHFSELELVVSVSRFNFVLVFLPNRIMDLETELPFSAALLAGSQ